MLYVLAIVRLARRELVWINVTAQPTANGLRSKLLKHSPGTKPTLPDLRLGRDLWCRCQAPITSHGYPRQAHCPASPWQSGFAERLIASIRRECVDHIVVLGEAHLRRIPAITMNREFIAR
jgi:hypothetical protein